MVAVLIQIPCRQTKVDQVNRIRVILPNENVLKLEIVVDISALVQYLEAFDLHEIK